MILKFWAGVITPAALETGNLDAWALSWLHKARKAERAGKELVILEIPKNKPISCLVGIEETAQPGIDLELLHLD